MWSPSSPQSARRLCIIPAIEWSTASEWLCFFAPQIQASGRTALFRSMGFRSVRLVMGPMLWLLGMATSQPSHTGLIRKGRLTSTRTFQTGPQTPSFTPRSMPVVPILGCRLSSGKAARPGHTARHFPAPASVPPVLVGRLTGAQATGVTSNSSARQAEGLNSSRGSRSSAANEEWICSTVMFGPA